MLPKPHSYIESLNSVTSPWGAGLWRSEGEVTWMGLVRRLSDTPGIDTHREQSVWGHGKQVAICKHRGRPRKNQTWHTGLMLAVNRITGRLIAVVWASSLWFHHDSPSYITDQQSWDRSKKQDTNGHAFDSFSDINVWDWCTHTDKSWSEISRGQRQWRTMEWQMNVYGVSFCGHEYMGTRQKWWLRNTLHVLNAT